MGVDSSVRAGGSSVRGVRHAGGYMLVGAEMHGGGSSGVGEGRGKAKMAP